MTTATTEMTLAEQALEVLRRAGNPFRNYFARNPDDEVCTRFHVPELFAQERAQLLGVVELYRASAPHSEIVPILGNKGAGKTHLLHSIKHGQEESWQLLVTPGTFQKDTDFLEYLLFQVIDTLLGCGRQKGQRPLEIVAEKLVRRLLQQALASATRDDLLEVFLTPGLGRWARRLGLGSGQAQERAQWLLEELGRSGTAGFAPLRRLLSENNLDSERVYELVARFVDGTEPHHAAGLIRRQLYRGFTRAALTGDESELASFLTYGFAELEFGVRPSRQDLVLSLFQVLMEVFRGLKLPVVVAFDQLEDLLLARRADDGQRVAEAFFAGIVRVMHQIDGICFLVFAERGLWNRFIPTLDGYIQDRLNNPVHLPGQGTIKALRLEAPPPPLVRRVVELRLRPTLQQLPGCQELSPLFPFSDEQVERISRTEPTLRDMLQQFRHLFDHVVYGEVHSVTDDLPRTASILQHPAPAQVPPQIKAVAVVETPAILPQDHPACAKAATGPSLAESWDLEMNAALVQLSPAGSLTGASRSLQAGLGAFLQTCHEHGVKVGPWRLQHVVPEWTFGEHPTYGVLSIAHWACKDGQPWKVGIGLFLGRGVGKPRDLETKLAALAVTPPVIDHLILLRPEDDLALSGKSKTLWQEAQRRGQHVRLEAVRPEFLATLYAFPRWLNALGEALPNGQPLPNLADIIQERCDKFLEQVCMPVCP